MRHDETVLPVAGSLVRAYRAGTGPELVLLHGGGADDARRAWEPVWTALTGHARVTAPDLPGYGGTPLGTTVPTVAGYASWLGAFLDACAIGPATLAGLSLGGRVARRAALAMPDRVTRLALHDVHGEMGDLACPVLWLSGPPGDGVAEELVAFLSSAATRPG
jgi:pimeloyl-ACP methyl ester carboxylesterase